jgi:hypothetical protein
VLATPVYAIGRLDNVIVTDAGREDARVTNNSLDVNLPSSISSDTVEVRTTARALGKSLNIYAVHIISNVTNSTTCWVGTSAVTKWHGFPVPDNVTGNAVRIKTDNLADVYVIGGSDANDSDFVHWIAEVR